MQKRLFRYILLFIAMLTVLPVQEGMLFQINGINIKVLISMLISLASFVFYLVVTIKGRERDWKSLSLTTIYSCFYLFFLINRITPLGQYFSIALIALIGFSLISFIAWFLCNRQNVKTFIEGGKHVRAK